MEIPSGYGQVNFIFTGGSAPNGAQCVFGVKNLTALSPLAIANFADSYYNTFIKSQMSAQVTLSGVLVKLGPTATGPSVLINTTRVGVGTGGNFPPNTAFLVKKFTSAGGHSGQGRMFLPGVAEAQADDAGMLAAGTISGFNTALGGFLNSMNGSDCPMVLLHNDPTMTPNIVTSLILQAKVATQRKRLRR